MWHLRPSIREGLICAAVHQIVALCAVASLFVSKPLSIFMGTFLFLADIPAFLVAVAMSEFRVLPGWSPPYPGGAPTAPLEALRYHEDIIALVLLAGALQWFLIGFYRAEDENWRASES